MRGHQNSRRLALGLALLATAVLLTSCGGGPVTAGWAGVTVDGENLYVAFRERVYAFTGGGIPLTNALAEVADPVWGPDGDRIAYAQKVDERFQLFLYIFGQEPQQLTQDARDHRAPAFSPDGTRLVFTADGDLYVLDTANPDGEPVRLTDTPATETDPSWSPATPEGERIAYVSDAAGNFDIYTMQTSGADVRQLTSTTADEIQPAWSPDASLIVYVADLDGNNDIYTIRASGGDRTQLTDNPADDVSPSWSADGAYLLFASNRAGSYDLYRMVANGSNVIQITDAEGDETDPHWQPGGPGSSGDRGRVVYVANLKGIPQIYAISPDQSQALSEPSWVFPTEAQQTLQFYAPPTPDGDRLYVGGYDRRVHALNIADGTPVSLGTDAEDKTIPWVTEQLEDIITDAVTVGPDLIYVGVSNRNVLAFRKDRPELVWTFHTAHGVWGSPLLVDNTLFVTSLDHHVYAVNATTGEEIWRTEAFDGAIPGRPTYDPERNLIYVGTLTNKVVAINASNGQVVNAYGTHDWVWGAPVLYDNRLYFADMGGWVYAFNPATWSEVWSQKVAGRGIRGSVLVTADRVYAASQDQSLYALNRGDGSPAWPQKQATSGQLLGDPAYVNNLVIVSPMNVDYLIAAYDEENGNLQWRFPAVQPGQ